MAHVKPHPSVVEFATRCFVEDVPVHHVLDRAKVNPSTWTRCRREGQLPRASTLERLNAALDELVAEREARDGETAAPQPPAD